MNYYIVEMNLESRKMLRRRQAMRSMFLYHLWRMSCDQKVKATPELELL